MRRLLAQTCFVLLILYMLPLILVLALIVFIARKFFHLKRIVIDGKKEYVFKETTKVNTTTGVIKGYTFMGPTNPWFTINPDPGNPAQSIITIDGTYKTGYAWDGCSPKFLILDLVMGTPDGVVDLKTGKPITYYASMAHDLLYQFRHSLKGSITRKQADQVFREQLNNANFELAGVYYFAVRAFGWTYWDT